MERDSQDLVSIALVLAAWLSRTGGEDVAREERCPTAADVARTVGLPQEKVKKRLRQLIQMGVVRPISLSPKRYQWDVFAWRTLPDDHPLRQWMYEHALDGSALEGDGE